MNKLTKRHLCIIPAKGFSQRFPEKNKALFNGKTLVALAIEVSLGAGIFDAIYVSSDDESILETANKYSVEAVMRPQSLAKDPASVKDVCKNLIETLQDRQLYFDTFSVVIPTSPLRTSAHLQEAMATFFKMNVECVMSMTPLVHPPQRALGIDKEGRVYPFFGQEFMKKTQELEQLYLHDGTIIVVNTQAFLAKGGFYNLTIKPYVIQPTESVDIDTALDLKWAKFLYEATKEF